MRQMHLNLALVLLAVFLLFGCAVPDTPAYVMELIEIDHGIGFGGNDSWDLTNDMYAGPPLEVNIQHKDFLSDAITYTLRTGVCNSAQQPVVEWTKEVMTVSNGTTLRLRSIPGLDDIGESGAKYPIVFTEIVIYCGDHIIGYAVLSYDRTAYLDDTGYSSQLFDLHLVEAYLFPKRDGHYQDVSKEYVAQCIAEAIENYGITEYIGMRTRTGPHFCSLPPVESAFLL